MAWGQFYWVFLYNKDIFGNSYLLMLIPWRETKGCVQQVKNFRESVNFSWQCVEPGCGVLGAANKWELSPHWGEIQELNIPDLTSEEAECAHTSAEMYSLNLFLNNTPAAQFNFVGILPEPRFLIGITDVILNLSLPGLWVPTRVPSSLQHQFTFQCPCGLWCADRPHVVARGFPGFPVPAAHNSCGWNPSQKGKWDEWFGAF